ncbi:MAG: hypothetical protein BWY15_01981 [Firmicutes bacterium ADurb.Bin193]|nr:MAG: hypothetical protein BWY15_01981 [Firmicutes bacterium ADurb.Bin193]
MELNYPQKSNGMFIISRDDMDDIANQVLRNEIPSVAEFAKEVDIVYLAKECLFLDILSKCLSPDKSTLGLIAFEDDSISCYDLRYNQKTLDILGGTIVVDISLSGQVNLPRRRFTIAHEVAHWILHRTYHSPTNQKFALKTVSCDSKNIENIIFIPDSDLRLIRTDPEWEEWQADGLAAALLMPSIPFQRLAIDKISYYYGGNMKQINIQLDPYIYGNIIRDISNVFNVSFAATEIRLKRFGFASIA